jgi:thiamine-phosphate pyrophosphorylase
MGLFQQAFRFPSRLYLIADGLGKSDEATYRELVEDFLMGGGKIIQLRAKEIPSRTLLMLAEGMRRATNEAGATFLINDRADVAKAVGADGVHVGQEDLPIEALRKVLGERAIIGVSTHTEEQALAAEQAGASYIGYGPIFSTATKEGPYAPRGLEALRRIRSLIRIPIVAIGGITEETFPQVLAAGADAAALISEIVLSKNRPEKIRRLLSSALQTS